MSENPVLLREDVGRVCRLTLNRPEKKNALSAELVDALVSTVEAVGNDPDFSAIVIRGAGGDFCSGYDLTEYSGEEMSINQDILAMHNVNARLEKLFNCPIPTFAEVQGYCLAGGTDIALSCDFFYVGRSAKIGYPAVRSLGVPPWQLWIYRVGVQFAKRMLLTGDAIGADEAIERGLALEAFDDEALPDAVLDIARRTAEVSRDCLIGNKSVLNTGLDLMGRQELNTFAVMRDAIAHKSPDAVAFMRSLHSGGGGQAFRARDSAFEADR